MMKFEDRIGTTPIHAKKGWNNTVHYCLVAISILLYLMCAICKSIGKYTKKLRQ